MGEIKVGEYIRTELGEIKQITEGFEFIIEMHNKSSNKIVKHSSNIIDLIEVGDYVNGQLVDEKWYDYANKEMRFYNNGNLIGLEGHIKSICTKEQFENIEYKVEE